MCHILGQKKGSQLVKCVTLGKRGQMCQTWLNGSHSKMGQLEKWVTIGKMGHSWLNGSHGT